MLFSSTVGLRSYLSTLAVFADRKNTFVGCCSSVDFLLDLVYCLDGFVGGPLWEHFFM